MNTKAVLGTVLLLGQSESAVGQSAELLLRELTNEFARPISVKACDYPAAAFYRSRSALLARVGTPEVHKSVETAVLRLERTGHPTFNIEWVLMIYARIMGTRASPRLVGLLAKPELVPISRAIEGSIAESQQLTAYVSDKGPFKQSAVATIQCDLREPRDALEGIVRSILTAEKLRLKENLYDADAKGIELSQMDLAGRNQLDTSAGVRAVGFRFDIDGTWGKAKPILDELVDETRVDATRFEIRTYFSNKTGESCGDMWVRFARSANKNDYKIDVSMLSAIMGLVRGCDSR